MLHSLTSYLDTNTGTDHLLFWDGTTPKKLNLTTMEDSSIEVLGAAIASSNRWQYALGPEGYLHAHNGTDKKFFDGSVWRDIGLPALTADDLSDVIITLGTVGLSPDEVAGITLTLGGTDLPYLSAPVEVNFWNNGDYDGILIMVHSSVPTPAWTATGNSLLFNSRNSLTYPMEWVTYDESGNLGPYTVPWPSQPAAHWIMTATTKIAVPKAGIYNFYVSHDDGFLCGIAGEGVSLVTGGLIEQGTAHHDGSIFNNYADALFGNNHQGSFTQEKYAVNFPAGGEYDIEFDLAQWYHNVNLTVQVNGKDLKNVPPIGTGHFDADSIGRSVYCVLFDELADVSIDPDNALGPPTLIDTVVFPQDSNLVITGLPNFSGSRTFDPPPFKPARHLSKLIAITGDGDTTARFMVSRFASISNITGSAGTRTITATGINAAVGDIIGFDTTGDPILDGNLFRVTYVVNTSQFVITTPTGATSGTVHSGNASVLIRAKQADTSVTIEDPFFFMGSTVDTSGESGILASTVDTATPGYLFFVSIYNEATGHMGNRVQIGSRIAPKGASAVTLSGLPDMTERDSEWSLIFGRTADGGEVPYAIMHADGSWLSSASTRVKITASQIDGAAELPFENDPPPAFANFWLEGPRLCGAKEHSPTVYRSGAASDAADTGTYMGDPAQSWSPSRIETFPTSHAIIGGQGFGSQSFVWTKNDMGILAELSGQTQWTGPFNTGIAGSWAFAVGWQNLPFWLSHDKQLCTIDPASAAPVPISGEYEAALLSKIAGQDLANVEFVYYRDSAKSINVLRMKACDGNGNPFTIVHDFNLQDANSPYGQAFEEVFSGPLASNFTHTYVRDKDGHGRVWAAASDNKIYQLYSGDNDAGTEYTADALGLFYVGPYHTAVKMIEWCGDENVEWFISDRLDTAADPASMTALSDYQQIVPGEDGNSHFQVDVNQPEMTHCYLWIRLGSHSEDGTLALNNPPHMPLETYGRIYLTAPVIGTTRGR